MSGLTGSTPLPSVLAQTLAAAEIPPPLVEVLAARQPGNNGATLQEILGAATGSGTFISGSVAEILANHSVTLTTAQGTEFTLQNVPPNLLALGSLVTLRLVATMPSPQLALLSVDGKPVNALLTRATLSQPAAEAAPAPPPATAPAVVAGTLPRLDGFAALAASLAAEPATIATGLAATPGAGFAAASAATAAAAPPIPGEAEAAPETAISSGPASAPAPAGDSSGEMIAVLVRAGTPRPGGTLPQLGTCYLLSVTAITPSESGTTEAAASAAAPNEPGAPATLATSSPLPGRPAPAPSASPISTSPAPTPSPAAAAPVPQPQSPTPPQAAASAVTLQPAASSTAPPATALPPGFVPQLTVLAGRAVAAPEQESVLVETALGTLELPIPAASIPPHSAVQLRITGAGAPEAGGRLWTHPGAAPPQADATDAPLATPLRQAAELLAALAPAALPAVQSALWVEPGPALAAAIFSFLSGAFGVGGTEAASRRWANSAARDEVRALGHTGLTELLDGVGAEIGQTIPAPAPGSWMVATLFYPGLQATQPLRVYRKARDEAGAVDAAPAGEHFVIEAELQRLGPFQFEGLVRGKRFDLNLRTRDVMPEQLSGNIRRIFNDALAISGYGGEIRFARLTAFPLLAAAGLGRHQGVNV